MIRLRTLLFRSPGVSALAAMIALVAILWGAPVLRMPNASTVQARPLA